MASTESPKSTCPICDQTDQVKSMQTAYNSGVMRCAPPDLPTRNVRMLTYITACIILVGICVFLIVTLIGGMENRFPPIFQLILAVVTLVSIITALAVSYYAFQRVVRGDNEAAELYPAYDKAMETWQKLQYCSRDDVVFDPATHEVVSNEQLITLRSFAKSQPEHNHGHIQSALVQH
ncbi:MAG TPA: hypothetical protein VL461_05395 [Dictyobacter sp.]|jgi:Zn-dependent protease with chaperone function|nr:hypothetical protein [Dictyobacter sp.]